MAAGGTLVLGPLDHEKACQQMVSEIAIWRQERTREKRDQTIYLCASIVLGVVMARLSKNTYNSSILHVFYWMVPAVAFTGLIENFGLPEKIESFYNQHIGVSKIQKTVRRVIRVAMLFLFVRFFIAETASDFVGKKIPAVLSTTVITFLIIASKCVAERLIPKIR